MIYRFSAAIHFPKTQNYITKSTMENQSQYPGLSDQQSKTLRRNLFACNNLQRPRAACASGVLKTYLESHQ